MASTAHPQITILLVEPSPATQPSIAHVLSIEGFAVEVASDGSRAIDIAEANGQIDAVLVDAELETDPDGIETAREILRRRSLPIVLLTDDTTPEQMARAEQLAETESVYGLLPKSTPPRLLAFAMRNAVRRFADAEHAEAPTKQTMIAAEDEARKLWEDATEIVPLSVAIVSLDAKVLFANRHALRLFDIRTLDDLRDLRVPLVWADPKKREDWVRALREKGSVYNLETEMISMSGKRMWLLSSGMMTTYQGRPAILSVHNEITGRKIEEDLVRRSERWFRSLADTTGSAIFIYVDDRYVYANEATLRVTGYTRDEFLGLPHVWDLVHPDHRDLVRERTQARLRGDAVPDRYELKIIRKDGTPRWLEVSAGTIEWQGRLAAIGTAFDITERHEALDRVNRLLNEKQIILKETHHRIKNNMTVIANLLLLEADRVGDSTCSHVLRDGASRAQSMMVLYDRLYRAGGTESLSLKEYLQPLVDEVVTLFPPVRKITTDLRIADVQMPAQAISSLGIIANELVTNSMKHAFAGRTSGHIEISAEVDDVRLVLTYRDDGVGLPEAVEIDSATTFGLQLVHLLVDQLNGTVTTRSVTGTADDSSDSVTPNGGAVFTMSIPLSP